MQNKLVLALCLVFVFSFVLRTWNLNAVGRTWDEELYIRWGYEFVSLIKKGDFFNQYWYEISGSPPVSRYLFGLTSLWDIERFNIKNQPIFSYDFTHTRLVSATLSSFTVVLIVLLGWIYFSPIVGVTAGIILSMLPLFIGYSQLATLESLIIFFFTATIFSFISLLVRFTKKKMFLTGILLGLSFGVKYTNILLVPLMFWIYLIWYFHSKNIKEFKFYLKKILKILLIALITFFIIWPMPWFHLSEVLAYNAQLRYSPYSVPEVFFGKLILVPKVYYIVYFLITTPIVVLLFFLAGLYSMSEKKTFSSKSIFLFKKLTSFIKSGNLYNFKKKFYIKHFFLVAKSKHKKGTYLNHLWIQYSLVAWFSFPFIQSLYNFKQHGIRYIIEIYAPLSLISAIGFAFFVSILGKSPKIKYIAFVFLFIYLSWTVKNISPYYLDYFSEIVGGTNYVFEKKLFQMGWWGQGIREAAYYLKANGTKKSTVGLALSPTHVTPNLAGFKVSPYQDNKSYDYVIVNYYNILREGFDDKRIKEKYTPVYTVKADRGVLVTVYRKK